MRCLEMSKTNTANTRERTPCYGYRNIRDKPYMLRVFSSYLHYMLIILGFRGHISLVGAGTARFAPPLWPPLVMLSWYNFINQIHTVWPTIKCQVECRSVECGYQLDTLLWATVSCFVANPVCW